jgi:GNAT superfamily N-acetyltransferase
MNRKQRRQLEKSLHKEGKDCFVGSNPCFSAMEENLGSLNFKKEPIIYSSISNESFYKLKTSPALVFDNGIVRAVITPEKEGLEITTIMVYPNYLSQGFGKLMLDFLLVTFSVAKVGYVSLYPQKKDPNDQISLAKCQRTLEDFYSKRGFEWNEKKTAMVLNREKYISYELANRMKLNLEYQDSLEERHIQMAA